VVPIHRTYSPDHPFWRLVVEICLDTIILSSSNGGARLAEPCYRRRAMDMERSNPFLDALHIDPDLDSEMEAGDEHEGETLPFNWLAFTLPLHLTLVRVRSTAGLTHLFIIIIIIFSPLRLSPDEIESSHSFTPQRDVWHLGVTFLRMIYGSDVVFRYPDLQAVLSSGKARHLLLLLLLLLPTILFSCFRRGLTPFFRRVFSPCRGDLRSGIARGLSS
jgi:hypothetical protein